MITIHPATPEDVRGMVEVFYKTWLATYPNAELGITVEDVEEKYKDSFTKENLEKRRQHMANTSDSAHRVIAKDGQRVVGLATMTRKENYNELQSLYILPEYQRQGLGGRLWEEVSKFAVPNKETVVFLATYNEGARRFYEKLGFVDTGVRDTSDRHRMPVSGVLIPIMKMTLGK